MLDFFHQAASHPSIQAMIGEGVEHPRLRNLLATTDYFEIKLRRDSSIASCVKLDHRTAITAERRYVRQSNHVNAPILKLGKQSKCIANIKAISDEVDNQHGPLAEIHKRLKLWGEEDFRAAVILLVKETVDEDEFEKLSSSGFKKVAVLVDIFGRVSSKKYQPFFSEESYEELSKLLWACDTSEVGGQDIDIYGRVGTLNESPMEKIRFGRVFISPFERNRNTSAYHIYGRSSLQTCPLTSESRRVIQEAAKMIGHENLHAKTWDVRVYGNRKVLLILYVNRMADDFAHSAGLIVKGADDLLPAIFGYDIQAKEKNGESEGEAKDSLELSTTDFIGQSQRMIQALRGETREYPNAVYNILIVSQPERGPAMTDVQESMKIDDFASRLEFWFKTIQDNPVLSKIKPPAAFRMKPLEIHQLLNRRWPRSMVAPVTTVNTFDIADSWQVFGHHDADLASRMLQQMSRYHVWLFFNVICLYRHFQLKHGTGKNSGMRGKWDVVHLPNLAAVLIAIVEESEMSVDEKIKNNPAFIIGQLLGIADMIHRSWYQLKGRRFPNKFVGEASAPGFLRGVSIHRCWGTFASRFQYFREWAFRQEGVKPESEFRGIREDVVIKRRWYTKLINQVVKDESFSFPDKLTDKEVVLFSLGYYSI